MNLKIPLRLGRILVVLALIVALLGSSIPVPARAVGFVPGLYDIAANIGVNAALRAIGVGPGNSPDAFNQLVTDATNNLFDGLSPLTQVFLDYTENGFRAFLSADFLADLLVFLFDSGSLELDSGSSLRFSVSSGPHGSGYYSCYQPFWVRAFSCNGQYVYFFACKSAEYVYFYKSGSSSPYGSWNLTQSAYPYLFTALAISSSSIGDIPYLGDFTGKINYSTNVGSMTRDLLVSYPSVLESVASSSDLSLDSVSDSLSAPVYSDWTAGAVTQENQSFVPVSIPSISDSTAIFTQTQAQAQAGTIPETVVDEIVAGAEVVPETGTIADVITAVRALGADIVAAVQAIPAAIADVFSPPAISDEYMISLSDFFPFCLPFDIYDLLSALAADPQAPVFEWTIAVPRWGISHDIEIDLSEWDDIARLFRTFELGAFVLGLALITRQKFLRS